MAGVVCHPIKMIVGVEILPGQNRWFHLTSTRLLALPVLLYFVLPCK